MEHNPDISVPKGSLLKIANNILELLDYPSELENEDDLFLDDFYIAIVGNLISDRKFELQPGKDNEEKVKSLTQLINLLSEIIEMDLSHISASGIINKHDRISAKCLLELIEELIKALINENENEFEKEENEETESGQENHKIEEIDQEESLLDSMNQKQNISAGNMNRHVNITDENIHNKELLEDDDMIEDLSANIQKMKENQKKKEEVKKEEIKPIEIKEKKKPEKEKEKEKENKIKEKEKEKGNLEGSSQNSLLIGNRSCFEALDFEKAMKDKIAYENGEDSYIRKTFTQNDISRYERDLAENEVENQLNENDLNYGGDMVNYGHDNDEKNLTDSHVMNVSHISGVSRSKDNSDNIKKKVSEGEIPDLLDDDERKNTSSFIKKQKEKVNEHYYDDEDDSNGEISANMIQEPSAHSAPNNANNRLKLTTTSDELIEASIDDLDNENIKKTNEKISSEDKNSENNSHNISNVDKSSKKKLDTKGSSNKKNDNINEKINTNSSKNQISQSDISKSSVKGNKKSQNDTQSSKKKTQNNNKNTTSENSSILEELPMDDEEFKYEIIKEFRRLYGNKLDRVFLKHNIQNSHDMLEIILRNIKLARQKMMKIENRIPDPDDLLTKEFMNRYEKELQYILDYYKKEKKKRNFFQERALKTMNQNVRVMKKIQEIQTKKMENEIERRRKAREVKNHHNQMKMCNEIYSRVLQLEKEKNLEDYSQQMELRKIENEEKRKAMMEIEKYYTDKIAILKEILKREKEEREIEHRAQIQFLSQIERERKNEFRKQIDDVFQRFDEEDRRAQFEDNNKEQIEKILNSYYKN